jgi:hypothetical protein
VSTVLGWSSWTVPMSSVFTSVRAAPDVALADVLLDNDARAGVNACIPKRAQSARLPRLGEELGEQAGCPVLRGATISITWPVERPSYGCFCPEAAASRARENRRESAANSWKQHRFRTSGSSERGRSALARIEEAPATPSVAKHYSEPGSANARNVAIALVNSTTADQEKQSSAPLASDGSLTPGAAVRMRVTASPTEQPRHGGGRATPPGRWNESAAERRLSGKSCVRLHTSWHGPPQ